MLRDQAIKQDVVGRESIGLAFGQQAVGFLMVGAFDQGDAEFELWSSDRSAWALVVPRVTTTRRPVRS